jgi:hypothetical protein
MYSVHVRIDGRGFCVQLTPKVKKNVDASTLAALKESPYIEGIKNEFGPEAVIFSDEIVSSETPTVNKKPKRAKKKTAPKKDDFFGED